MAKKTAITCEILDKRVEWTSGISVRNAMNKYFCLPYGDPNRPSKEVAIHYIKRLEEHGMYIGERGGQLAGMGYFSLVDLLEGGIGNIICESTNIFSGLFDSEGDPFTTDAAKLEALLNREYSDHREAIARKLLSIEGSFSGRDRTKVRRYMKFIDKCFHVLAKASGRSSLDMWRRNTYLPSQFIIGAFKETIGFDAAFREVATCFEIHVDRHILPYEQLVDDLIPFFSSLPRATKSYPYCANVCSELIIKALEESARDLGKDTEGRRVKVYNTFIKPLLAEPKIIKNLEYYRRYSSELKDVSIVAAAVVPAADVMRYIKEVVFALESNPATRQDIIESMTNVKTNCKLPVSEEFINFQFDMGIYEGAMCFNNECINDINFWVKRRAGGDIFPHGLSHNRSFHNNFKIKEEDMTFYKENRHIINWSVVSRLPSLTKEYVKEFIDFIPMHRLSDKVLAVLDEEIVKGYMENGTRISSLFFEQNKNLGAAFLAANAPQLFYSRGSMCYCEHIKLTDLVAEL